MAAAKPKPAATSRCKLLRGLAADVGRQASEARPARPQVLKSPRFVAGVSGTEYQRDAA